MYIAQITYYANKVATFEQEISVEHSNELRAQVAIEERAVKSARTYDEVCVSCAELDFVVTFTK
jgi:hypothetical protein